MIDVSVDAYYARIAVCEAAAIVRDAMTAPSVLYKPVLSADGNMWCALYGENLQEGVAGFGKTPAEAMSEFDKAWSSRFTPAAMIGNKKD